MKLSDLDLSGFKYDPSNDKDIKKLQDDYPEAFCPHWLEHPKLINHEKNILRYIIILYDINSPLWETIKKHEERKIKAMLLAGFEHGDDGKFNYDVEDALLYGRDRDVATMIVKYVYLFNSIDFSELVGMIEYNSQILRDIMNRKTNNQTMKNLQETSARIKNLTSNIFGGKETREIEERLYEELAMSKLSLRPEHIVRQMMSGNVNSQFKHDPYKRKVVSKKADRLKEHGDA